jgi:transposase
MANARMPDEFFEAVAHHLPPEQPVGPLGGRPRVRHRVALRVIWFVLATGDRWDDVPHELGCSGRTAPAGSGRGRRPASGTGSTPTCSGCCGRRASWTPTWW